MRAAPNDNIPAQAAHFPGFLFFYLMRNAVVLFSNALPPKYLVAIIIAKDHGFINIKLFLDKTHFRHIGGGIWILIVPRRGITIGRHRF
jgi:hypothetical protein